MNLLANSYSNINVVSFDYKAVKYCNLIVVVKRV